MKTTGISLIRLVAIVAIFVMILAAIYAWILPTFFHGYKTYSFLVVGVVTAAAISGYYSYRNCVFESLTQRWLLSASYAVGVAFLVMFFSLFIILNTRGS